MIVDIISHWVSKTMSFVQTLETHSNYMMVEKYIIWSWLYYDHIMIIFNYYYLSFNIKPSEIPMSGFVLFKKIFDFFHSPCGGIKIMLCIIFI